MALAQGELTIVQTANGARIDMGSGGHTVSGSGAVKALMDAYGSRIGKVVDSSGNTTVVNEFKEPPRKEVDSALLREVPSYKRVGTNENGETLWGVEYSDGTISHTGAGREGVLEASRRRSSANLYNEFITDARTREDFANDYEYQNFLTVKNIRIGQGSYVKMQDKNGNSKLVAPNGAVVAEGTVKEIHSSYISKTNELNLAMAAAERTQTFSTHEKRYVMERENLTNDGQFNEYVRSQIEQSRQALTGIYSSWNAAAQEQGVDFTGKMWYQPTLPDLSTFVPTINPSTGSYEQWYKSVMEGITPTEEDTVSGVETGTETTQVLGDQTQQQQTTTEAVSQAANQAIQTPQDLPQTVSYEMPQNYTGSGYMPGGTGTGAGMGSTTMAPMTGTFTKPAGSGMLGSQQSQQYTLGQTSTQTPQVTQPQQAEVRMYRNNAGMTTSITFMNGQPQTPIPSGFYPVGSQPAGQTPYTPLAPQVQTPTVQTPVQTQAPNVSVPTVQPVTGYMPQFNMNQGGIVPSGPMTSTPMFNGFKPEAMQRIANGLGYNGDMSGFDQYLNSNPDKQQKMNGYMQSARKMAEGGVVQKFNAGGGPDAYIGPADGPVFQVVNPGPASGVPIQVVNESSSNNNSSSGAVQSTSNQQQIPESITTSLQQYDPRVLNQQYIPQQPDFTGQDITEVQAGLAKTPGLPTGATVVPTGTQLTAGQLVSPYSGQVAGSLALPTALAVTEQATMPMTGQAALTSPVEAAGAVRASVDQTQAAQLQQVAGIAAAQQETTSVSNLQAAQGTGILMNNPTQRQIQDGELISAAANAQTAATFNEQIQAATAEPSTKATVQGQLEGLMAQFEGGETPAWAAGSMRNAMATLSARGLGASSLAGQAVIQAAMESALPIAQMDAQVQAQFEGQNLSNRQQRAMLAAQQRAQFLGQEFDQAFQSRVANAAKISDIANMNFTAEQQVALENSRIANTMELTNLSNSQAMVLAEASALANLDMQNLNNRQQASVQNAQNFLQADLTNLSNQQQTELFKAQQRVQSLFTDQAAINAAQQFNASSQNQVDQFYSSLQSNTAQFNASQANAQGQFNAGQVNVIERFNAEINNQRDQFNAQNRLIIDQSNAQWRREIATADTASVNRANEVNAQAMLGYSQQAYNNLWQYYADNMEWAWTSAENERQRYMNLTVAKMQQDTSITLAKAKEDYESSSSFGGLIGKVLTSDLSNTILGGIFG